MVKAINLIIGIFGLKGGGKTTTAVLFILLESMISQRSNLFANLRLEIEGFEWLKGHDMIELTDKLNDSIILVDELHEYADSRNSGSFQNKRVSDFFLQSRHTKSNVYYTTQFKDQIQLLTNRHPNLPPCRLWILFSVEFPKSYSVKKQVSLCGTPHRQRPDVDNYLKAVFDAFGEDKTKWDIRASKFWSYEGGIFILTKTDFS